MNNSFKKFIKIIWISTFSVILLVSFLFFAASIGWLGYMPSLEELENPKSYLASEIISADQKVLGTYFKENRSKIEYNQLSPHLINALQATEDIRFLEHSGIDARALGRAIFGALTFNSKGGGSTITQQLAKQLFHNGASSKFERLTQKIKEWVIAAQLENRYTKEEILAMYFNKFDFLNLAVGVKSASKVYFNTSADSLKIEEAATLVGMCKNPALFNPLRRLEKTEQRRNVVLSQMKKYDYITQEEYDSLRLIPLTLDYQKVDHKVGSATYFREYLRLYLDNWCNTHSKPDGTNYNLYRDGLKVYTTINSKMQKYAEEAVKEHLQGLQKIFFKQWEGKEPWRDENGHVLKGFIDREIKKTSRYKDLVERYGKGNDSINIVLNTPVKMKVFTWNGDSVVEMSPIDSMKYHKHFLHTGFMSMDPQSGFVRAYVGGIDYNFFQYDHVTVGKRQVGSTFKPFVYLLAMQSKRFTPCSEVPNIPVTFHLPEGKTWTPQNSGYKELEGEMISLKKGLAYSLNYLTAYLMKQFGPEAVIKITQRLGITSHIDPVPSICLGTADLSVKEIVAAHATFANKGVWTEPVFITRIEDSNGTLLDEFSPESREVMDEETAYLMIDLMKGVTQQGTAIRLRTKYKMSQPIAGKTGTTQNHSDGWFIGSTPDLVSGVWVGCDDRSIHFRSIQYGQGANLALPIWALYMQKVWADKSLDISQKDFEKPLSLVGVNLDCNKTNIKKTNNNSNRPRFPSFGR